MKRTSLFFLLLLLTAFSFNARSQPGTNDPTFNPTDVGYNLGYGADDPIYTTAIQSDGKIIIGGVFESYNETQIYHFARLNADGTLDSTFYLSNGASSIVYTTVLQNDGKIIIGGNFTAYNGTARSRIARLNTDGTLDVTFNPGMGANSVIFTTAIQSNGKIIIGGEFSSYNGTTINRIARLNTDGTLDATFNIGTGVNYDVYSTAIQNDGKIIIGGEFTSYNGTVINHIARLNTDGTLDATFNTGIGLNSYINAITIQSDGKIIIGGDFTSYNGIARNRIARLNADGTLDVSFNSGTSVNSYVYSTSVQSDGKIIIGGEFTSFNGTAKNRIVRINTDGTLDATFNTDIGANGGVKTAIIQSNGKIIISGEFTSYNGTARNHITRINANGMLDTSFNPGTGANGFVYTSAIQSDGKIIIGGYFSSYNGTPRNNIARLNTGGTLDANFNPGTGANNYIYTTTIQSDGKILIGGQFNMYNGTVIGHIARLNANGTLDTTFNPGLGPNGDILTTAIQNDGKIIIGGEFTTCNGTPRNDIARLNTDGALDATFNLPTSLFYIISTTAIQSDGKIIIGGGFSSFISGNGSFGRLNNDGTVDATFNPGLFIYLGLGPDNHVSTISIQSDGKIIIGGDFTFYNGIGRNRVARILNCGTTSTITETACVSYTAPDGLVYTTSGIKTAIIPNSTGCDSIITINLTINPVDVSLTVNNTVITANGTGANYLWVDCDNNYSPVSGETNQSFTATVNGNFAVIVTQGSCSDTSVCTPITSVGMSSVQKNAFLSIYPNPVSDELIIEIKGSTEKNNFEILNALGQIVFKSNFIEKTTIQTRNFIPGVYFVKLENSQTFEIKKVVKE